MRVFGGANRAWFTLVIIAGGCSDPQEAPNDSQAQPQDTGGADESTSTDAPQPAGEDDGSDEGPSPGDGDGSGGSNDPDPEDDSGGSSESESGETTGAPQEEEPDTGPYPIVLSHGFFGFEDFAGLDFINYYFGVVEHLDAAGETEVFTPTVDPFNDSTERGLQLLNRIEDIVEHTGASKVNIIAHSQGGLDARVVAHLRPDLVASLTTISAPHYGTPVADIFLGLVSNDQAQDLVDIVLRLVGSPLWEQIDGSTSISDSMVQMSSEGAAEFNELYTDSPSVTYFSLAGRSDRHDGGEACIADNPPDFIVKAQDERDLIDPLLSASEAVIDGGLLNPDPNDGLVLVRDAKWGRFLGCIPADHLDEIGHLFGDRPGLTNGWDYKVFYADLIGFLRDEGF